MTTNNIKTNQMHAAGAKHHSHITLCGVNPLCDGLNGHPAKREFPISGLDVDIILSSQTKVGDLQHFVLPHQHIPAGKVSVDNAQLG